LLFGLLQGLLLGLFLFRKKVKDLTFLYLVLILTLATMQMIFKLVSKLWMFENIKTIYFLSYKLPLLMGPLLFLFIQSHIRKEFQKRDLLHFVPFVLFSLSIFLSYTPFARLGWMSMYNETILSASSLLIYSFLSWRWIRSHADSVKKFNAFIGAITLTELGVIGGLAFLYLTYPTYNEWRFLFIPLTLLVYWMSYKVMAEPNYFFESGSPTLFIFRHASAKYQHSGLKESEADKIFSDLQALLTEQKPYLKANLTIDLLATQLSTTRHNLSQVINMRFNKTYGELINDHRLAEVQKLLVNPRMKHFTIAAIALDSGFNSVSGFNEIFKKKTGLTPSKYREQHQQRMTA
jgi:AraC-like DNA-binding protein